ncbi:MAG TPA: ComF family protein [Steroidobacteraceae bacterium]|nr:ComF family protein [Steroidobacteraceae bacterium]
MRVFDNLSIPSAGDLEDKRFRFDKLRADVSVAAAFRFSEAGKLTQTLIHHAKYNSMMQIAVKLGKISGQRLPSTLHTFDYLVPIPLHRTRLAERGYNQAERIAKGLSKSINVPISRSTLLRRIKPTPTQTGLTAGEREENVRDAFALSANTNLKGKKVILVDDVMTTGATLASAAHELDKAEPAEIAVVSVSVVTEIQN